MSVIDAALILAWIMLLILASSVAGLVIRFAELRREVEVALALGPEPGDESLANRDARLPDGVLRTLVDELGLEGEAYLILVVDAHCGICEQALADLARLVGRLQPTRCMALVETKTDVHRVKAISPDLAVAVSTAAWAAVPGSRPVLVSGDRRGASVTPLASRDDLLRELVPHLSLLPDAAKGHSR